MATIRQINQILKDSEALRGVAQAYTEISALKLQRIRFGIEGNRKFFQEITEVFHIVNVEAAKRNISRPKKSGSVSILLTPNHHFSGALNIELIKFFIANTSQFPTAKIVIGKIAREYFQALHYQASYQHLIFQNDLPTATEIRQLVEKVTGFEQIMVYYPRMRTVLVQEPHVVDIVQKPPAYFLQVGAKRVDYIFEPEIAEITRFFESQITLLLLEQTFLEAELARTAARLISMDQAQIQADKFIKKTYQELALARKSVLNIQLLESIAAAWPRREEVSED